MRTFTAALALGLVVLAAAPWGHAAESRAEWFRVSWEPRPTSVVSFDIVAGPQAP